MSYSEVRSRIQAACQRRGRSTDQVRLVAVSKKQPVGKIQNLFTEESHLDFGENYVQEGVEKILILRELLPDRPLSWHCIGPLQRRKPNAR